MEFGLFSVILNNTAMDSLRNGAHRDSAETCKDFLFSPAWESNGFGGQKKILIVQGGPSVCLYARTMMKKRAGGDFPPQIVCDSALIGPDVMLGTMSA